MLKLRLALLCLLMLLDKLFPTISATMFKTVCLGGTFDGIHAGHKVLFGEALKVCSERLVVGVTDTKMIKNKVLWELIMPVEDRIQNVRDYLTNLKPELKYSIVPINDIYGPTILEKDLDCIVVSNETVRGAKKINEARIEKGWHELNIHIAPILEDDNSSHRDALDRLQEKKVSSSLIRIEKLGSILREPKPNDSIPNRPYLIGLTGGVASGKTAIAKYLESLGFGCINYDLLGHETYSSIDSPIYKKIVDFFGSSILNETTKQIERSRLGKIVFSDRTKLETLNSIVWPGIYELVDKKIEQLKIKHDVIVLESALLIESGQTKRVHQVWTTIVPEKEAIKRQVESRGLSYEEAEKRVNAQTDNLTRVKQSNVIFCSLWEPEFTQQQVKKCVTELREKYLK